MTDIEQALAEAMWELVAHVNNDLREPFPIHAANAAKFLMTTKPMQAIAREAAVGRAFIESGLIEKVRAYDWLFSTLPDEVQGAFTANVAAIAAALGDDYDLVEPPSEAIWRDLPESRFGDFDK